MPAPGSRSLEKEKHWRSIFLEWEESGLEVVAFCRSKRLSPAQFYKWKRRIRELDGLAVPVRTSARPRMAARAKAIAAQAKADASRAVEFAEVKIIDPLPQVAPPASRECNIVLEIVFASGVQLRLAKSCPPELLEAAVAVLECR